MKETVKVGLIGITAIAIVVLLFLFTKRISHVDEKLIQPQSFQSYIENRVNKEIKEKPYKVAKIAFYEVLGEIQTEVFAQLNDSALALSYSDSNKCKKVAFYAYAPIFASYGKSYFEQQTWTLQDADEIRDEANVLLSFDFAESGTVLHDDLAMIVWTVKEYHEALTVIKNASGCNTVEAVNKSIAEAKKYKHDPLTNNKKLQADLNNVPAVAKDGLANKLISRASIIIGNNCDYLDYPQWYEAYTNMVSAIEQYENAFGNNSKLAAKKTQLEAADEDALNCYD